MKIFGLLLMLAVLTGCQPKEPSPQSPSASAAQPSQAGISASIEDYIPAVEKLFAEGKALEAMKLLKLVTEKNPNDEKAYFILGQTFLQAKQYESAIDSFHNVIRIDPESADAYLLLGGCYDLLGNREEAIAQVKKSAELFEKHRDAENFKKAVTILHSLMGANQ